MRNGLRIEIGRTWLAAAVSMALAIGCSEDSSSSEPAPFTGSGGAAGLAAAGSGAGGTGQAPPNTGTAGTSSGAAGASAGASGTPSLTAGSGGQPAAAGDGAGAAGTAGSAAGAGGTSDPGPAKPLTVEDFEMRGPYTVTRLLNQGAGTISNGAAAMYPTDVENDPTAFTLYFPENSGENERFPLLTWGNGTYVLPAYYDELIEHVVSHGFVVIGANHSQVGSGQQMIEAVEWAIAQSEQSGSPIFGKVDAEHIGAFGQSQGGSGTCNAGLDSRMDAIAPLSGIPLDGGGTFTSGLEIPAFFVNSADEDASSRSVENIYERVTVPAIYGVTAGGNHNSYGDAADDPGFPGLEADDAIESRAGITAWFEWQLKDRSELASLFVGASCGFCSGSTWKTIKSKGF